MTTASEKAAALRNAVQGKPLHPNAAIQQEYAAAILTLVRRLHDDIRRELARVFQESVHHGAMDANDAPSGDPSNETNTTNTTGAANPGAQFAVAASAVGVAAAATGGGTVASQARIALNALLDRYGPLFNRIARKATARMIARTVKNSHVTVGMSLREIARDFTFKPGMSARMEEIIRASTTEAASYITLLPQEYLTQVQGAVMRSIIGGGGLEELVPFLNGLYGKKIRWARMVAMDQTRKAHSNITMCQMLDRGVRTYKWLHIGGSTHPRPRHVELSGEICSFDDPPIISEDNAEQVVRGHPGTQINCRCIMIPVIKFNQE